MEPADPSHTRSHRKDLRDLEAVIWIATNAMDGIGESLVADPPHPPVPHPRDRKRQLPLQGQLSRGNSEKEGDQSCLDPNLTPGT